MRATAIRLLFLALAAGPATALAAPPPGTTCNVLPADNVWNTDISSLPVHARSASWIASMNGASAKLHPDFGGPFGLPYAVVPGSHPKVSVDFDFADESDPGPYPFGADTPLEDGGDSHALMIDRDTCTLYELYAASWNGGAPTAGSGAIFNLGSNALRPSGWTSADAAGLPIFPGLVRWDEVQAGAIDHAIRFTAQRTDRSFLWPARHQAGAASDPTLPPMGARFRLKSSFAIGGFSAPAQVILKAMQHYGLILADNGSNWFFQGATTSAWPDSLLAELKTVPASAFEAVDESALQISPDSAQARQPTGGGAPGAAVSPASINFKRVTVGSTSAGRTITVSNGGTANLVVSQVRLAGTNTGDYRIASSSCSTVTPGASCAVVIQFAPKSSGAKYATVQIIDNASGSPQKVALAGTGR